MFSDDVVCVQAAFNQFRLYIGLAVVFLIAAVFLLMVWCTWLTKKINKFRRVSYDPRYRL